VRANYRSVSLLVLSGLVYASAFFLPAFSIVVEGKESVYPGYEAFVIGFLSIGNVFFGGPILFMVWAANVCYWLSIWLFVAGRVGKSFMLEMMAVGLAAMLWLFNDARGRELILVGYYLWVLGMALATLASGLEIRLTWTDGDNNRTPTMPAT